MIKYFAKLLIVALILGTVSSCEKDDDDEKKESVVSETAKTVEIDAASFTDWVYFSFADGGAVEVSDPANDLTWDIAFLRTHLKTNSGASGSGQGGALNKGQLSFDDLLVAPETGYTVDDTIQISDPNDPTYQTMMDNPGSTVLEEWGTLDVSSHPPVYTPSNDIFVVKTADGKYAKIHLKSYYNSEGTSAQVTMDYFYQADGTTTLE